MVARENLDLVVKVRILAGQPWFGAPEISEAIFGFAHHGPEQANEVSASKGQKLL